MNKAEYWILESVIDLKRPVDWFATNDPAEVAAAFNRSLSGLTLPDLRAAFVRLALDGALCIRHLTREAIIRDTGGDILVLTQGELEAALLTPGPRWYELTQHGGQLWEAYASPDWGRYVAESYGIDYAIIEAEERMLAENYVAWQHYVSSGSVVHNTIQVDPLVPWQATYWKTLPHGCRISFEYEPHGPFLRWGRGERSEIRRWLDGLRKWYRPAHEYR